MKMLFSKGKKPVIMGDYVNIVHDNIGLMKEAMSSDQSGATNVYNSNSSGPLFDDDYSVTSLKLG